MIVVILTALEPVTARDPDPVAFVNVIPVLLASVVNIPVPTWKLPLPVAFVNVMPVLLTVDALKNPVPFVSERVVPVALVKIKPVEETTPAPLTRNFVVLPTWKLMKSPLKVLVGFAPKNVPEALPPVMKLEPKRNRVDVEVCGGKPAICKLENGATVAIPKLRPL